MRRVFRGRDFLYEFLLELDAGCMLVSKFLSHWTHPIGSNDDPTELAEVVIYMSGVDALDIPSVNRHPERDF